MVSEGEIWKLEKDLCRCCHAEGNFDNLANEQEIYSDMLRYCFDIDVTPVPGALCAVTYTICPDCILKLRDASAFKKQVQLCEEKFLKFYYKKAITVNEQDEPDQEVKDEPEVYFDMDFPKELSPDEDMPTKGKYKIHDYEDDIYNNDQSEDEEEEEKVIKKIPTATKKKKEPQKQKTRAKEKQKEKKTQKEKEKEKEKQKETDETQKEGAVPKAKFRLQPCDYATEDEKLRCKKCDKLFVTKKRLGSHMRSVHYKLPRYKCNICKMEIMTLTQFVTHKLNVHNIDDRLHCSACQALFNSKRQLGDHMNGFHMMGRKYKCPSCDFETYNHRSLESHKYKHKTVKDNQCKFCKKAFLRRATLVLHEKIHTGDKKKVCKVCSQAFVQKASLNYHMTKYHPEVVF